MNAKQQKKYSLSPDKEKIGVFKKKVDKGNKRREKMNLWIKLKENKKELVQIKWNGPK